MCAAFKTNKMWQAGFHLAASPLASRGGSTEKAPRAQESRQLRRLLLAWVGYFTSREMLVAT